MQARDQVLSRALSELRQTARGADRRQIVANAAGVLGLSESAVYRQLQRMGWETGRARRADRGTTTMSPTELEAVAQIMAKGRNKRGQANIPTRQAVAIAQEQGLVQAQVSYPQVCRLLRGRGLSHVHMRAPEPGIARVSTHPNHVWFLDISVAIQWYFKDEAGRRKLGLYSDGDARFYEGKRKNLVARDRVLHRYMIVDHRTGAYFVQYYYAAGEDSVDVADFLVRAFGPKFDVEKYPFRGLPVYMVADQGPALKSSLVQTMLEQLGIKCQLHAAGNAKASGAVETRHNHWQRTFEGRLALRPAEDVAQINYWAERYCALALSETPHSRHGQTPMAMWMGITPEQLVEAPSREVMLQLAAHKKRTGTLTNRLHLRADGRTWELSGEHVHPGQKVQYRLAPFAASGIRCWDAEGRELSALELSFDAAGFQEQGRRHVWDDPTAKGSTAPLSVGKKLSAAVASGDEVVQLGQLFDDLDERLAKHAYLNVQSGSSWKPGTAELHAAPLMSSVEAREEIAGRLGRPLTRDEGAWWRARLGDGCTQDELELSWDEFTTGARAPITADNVG